MNPSDWPLCHSTGPSSLHLLSHLTSPHLTLRCDPLPTSSPLIPDGARVSGVSLVAHASVRLDARGRSGRMEGGRAGAEGHGGAAGVLRAVRKGLSGRRSDREATRWVGVQTRDTDATISSAARLALCSSGLAALCPPDVLRVEFERPAGESDRSKQRGAFARPFGHSQLGGGVGVGGLGVGVGGVAGGRGSHGHHHGALAAAGGGGAGRKRSSLMLQTGGQSLPLHSNTLHQQQMAMAAAAATPVAALSSPSSVAPASSPSAASMASGNGASATSAGNGGASGAQLPLGGAGSGSSNLLARGRMEMFCAQSEQVVVAIFVNPDYDVRSVAKPLPC